MTVRKIKPFLRNLWEDRSGAAGVVLALSMPVTIGGLGFGAEVGYWYFNQRKVQNSADMAAYAGAVALRADRSESIITSAALEAAEETGYNASRGTIVTTAPPASGGFIGDADSVEVTVQENLPRMFSALFNEGDVPVSARAVAQISAGSQTCVLALDEAASGAVTFTGSTDTILVGCTVHSNSLSDTGVVVAGSADVETPCVASSGGVSATSGLNMTLCRSPYEYADQVNDPYADVPVPDLSGPCKSQTSFGGGSGSTYAVTEGHYCGGMTVSRNVNMAPGMYIIDGGELNVGSQGSLNGTGVSFYLTNGATIIMNGTSDVHLSAPSDSSDPYFGVMVFVDRNEPYNTHRINGDNDSRVNGAIYAPSGNIEMLGGSTANNGCTQVVARTITFSGNSGIGIDCTGTGVRDIRSSRLVTLVE
jgi:hypothetical protein